MIINQRIVQISQNKYLKKTIVIVGITLAIGSVLISVEPEPFEKTGYLGILLYGMLGPVTMIIPVMSQKYDLILLSIVASVGVCLNDTVAYVVGRNADVFIQKSKKVIFIEKYVNRYGYWALIVISILPIPYDFIGLIVGYLDLSFKKYIIPLFIGKFLRFILVGMGTSLII